MKLYSNHLFSCCYAEYESLIMPAVNNVMMSGWPEDRIMWKLWNSDTFTRMRVAMTQEGHRTACSSIGGQPEVVPMRCIKKPVEVRDILPLNATEGQRENVETALKSIEKGEEMVKHCPVKLELRLDTICNLDCEMCSQKPWRGPDANLPLSLFRDDTFLEFLSKGVELTLTGGEPTISPRFPKVLDAVREAEGAKVFLITNGHRLRESVLEDEDLFSLINVSLDAGDAETYAQVRRGGDWDLVCDQIREFQREKRNVYLFISCVVSGWNFEDLAQVVRKAWELGVDHVAFGEVHSLSSVMSSDERLKMWQRHLEHPRELLASIEEAASLGDDLGVKVKYSLPSIGQFA